MGSSQALIEGAAELAFDGRLEVSGVTPHGETSLSFVSLSGARVRAELPAGWQAQSISAHVLMEPNRGGPIGFQRGPRGASLLNLLTDVDTVHPDSIVTLGGGVLAHYRLDWGPEAVSGFTLWQGPWSDVFTFDHVTFDEALEAFTLFAPRDAAEGAVVDRPAGWALSSDAVTIDCGPLVINLRRRDEGIVPPWSGARGTYVELYQMEDHTPRVLAVSKSAVGVVGRDTGHDPVPDDEVASMAAELDLDWS